MSNQEFNLLTLLPVKILLQEHLFDHSHNNLTLVAVAFLIFASISFLYNLIMFFIIGLAGHAYVVGILADVSRMAYYFIALFFGRKHKRFQIISVFMFPFVCVIVITEVYIYLNQNEMIVSRLFSLMGIFLMHTLYMPLNFPFALSPTIISLAYPFIRTFDFKNSDNIGLQSNDSLLLIINAILTFTFCAYVSKKAYISDVCNYYSANLVNVLNKSLD